MDLKYFLIVIQSITSVEGKTYKWAFAQSHLAKPMSYLTQDTPYSLNPSVDPK